MFSSKFQFAWWHWLLYPIFQILSNHQFNWSIISIFLFQIRSWPILLHASYSCRLSHCCVHAAASGFELGYCMSLAILIVLYTLRSLTHLVSHVDHCILATSVQWLTIFIGWYTLVILCSTSWDIYQNHSFLFTYS